MCGIVGIVAKSEVNQDLFNALIALQHRGQDAAGIATCTAKKRVHLHKGKGLVYDVFRLRHLYELTGNYGIGHVRYPTAGTDSLEESQPFYVNSPYGIALAHNGNLINTEKLRKDLWEQDLRHINSDSDTELLLNVFAHKLQCTHHVTITPDDIFDAVRAVHQRCQGAYAVVAMIAGSGIVGFRDPHGIRPIVYGKRETPTGPEYMIASESVVLETVGFTLIGDIAPGEAIYITPDGQLHRQQCADKTSLNPCVFEFIYLAAAASIIDKISVYSVRLRLGELLAEKIRTTFPNHNIDVVMPVPDTSRPVAFQLAQHLGVKFREGLVRNAYVGRTFIMNGQQKRSTSVRRKLMALGQEFRGQTVLLVDDSIVRGTTAKAIIALAREAGAKQVYFASAAPEIRYPNVYGIDMPVATELMAFNKTVSEICKELGADWLIFQDHAKLISALKEFNPQIQDFEDSVFSGKYLSGSVTDAYLKAVANLRRDKLKTTETL